MNMTTINPTTITDSMIVQNNIVGSTYLEWSSSTSYSIGDKVKVESIHKEYECLIANTDKNPTTDPIDETTGNPYWLDLGSTNDWALFDGRSRKPSINQNSIVVSVKPNKLINSVAILNIEANSLNITAVSDSAGVVFNEDIDLRRLVNNFYDWFFSSIERIDNAVRLTLPAYTDMTITITLTGNEVKVGEFIIGKQLRIGCTQYGLGISINDYSTKETDIFGNSFVVERAFADRIEYDVLLENNMVNTVKRFLSQYRATPLVYIGDERLEETITYGFFKRFSLVIQDFSTSQLVLEVEELQ